MTVDPWQIICGLLTILVGALSHIHKGHANTQKDHARALENHSERLAKVEAAALTKADMKELGDRLDRTLEMHVAYIRTAIEQVKEDVKEAKEAAKERR